MSYRWQVELDGAWVGIAAADLPETLRGKKSVMWSEQGAVTQARDAAGRIRRYRLANAALAGDREAPK